MISEGFSEKLLQWHQQHGRKHLPWQQNKNPYYIWVSEIMLQQTQVITVIEYYQRFMQRFPSLPSLADASLDEVLHLWAGLGYYSRARNLHRCAQQVVAQHQGQLPVDDLQAMQQLPGIGPSTAAAICAFSTGQRAVILDGNVKRVVSRYFAVPGWPGQTHVSRELWQKADQLTPHQQLEDYTQAIMDLGATICTPRKPVCNLCPVAAACQARQLNLTGQLPEPRPKKILPEKHRFALVLLDIQQRIRLEQRPDSGIWGGLWSLPEFENLEALHQWLRQQHPTAICQTDQAEPMKHTFSHYRLILQPILARLPEPTYNVTEPQPEAFNAPIQPLNWYDPQNPVNIGLAAPVTGLIKSLSKSGVNQ
ncbi:MAG: A/G-specific adenine glycosylase [Marinospirillum sp.]|uniref:A/G-specific adenine glycosylase n=1 Tax=Marinospirillum sp. TaxID=2183934 RepID=UPI0019F465BC|nr:A/G-specific adenine glycosylase [Marinospirillum sp.]MBE0506157.1 A/G-specific adenine glycosylase [Marinospirillum sp.]